MTPTLHASFLSSCHIATKRFNMLLLSFICAQTQPNFATTPAQSPPPNSSLDKSTSIRCMMFDVLRKRPHPNFLLRPFRSTNSNDNSEYMLHLSERMCMTIYFCRVFGHSVVHCITQNPYYPLISTVTLNLFSLPLY